MMQRADQSTGNVLNSPHLSDLPVPEAISQIAPVREVNSQRRVANVTVLIIDDEKALVDLLRYNLEREGLRVLEASDGETGFASALELHPDLILLDRMLPGLDGIDLCRRFRAERILADIPVVFLTARVSEVDRVEGLDAGADDYVIKPFSPKELVARGRARLRRSSGSAVPQAVVRNGDLVIDESRLEVTYGGRPIRLSLPEFRILQFLAACPGRVMFRRSSAPCRLLLGQMALQERLITRVQLRETVAILERNPSRRVGELLVERFCLSPKDLAALLELQAQAFGERQGQASQLLGRIVITRGLATEFQVNEALRLQGRLWEAGLHPIPRLGEILRRRGYLSEEALATALQIQNFMLYRCPSCGGSVAIHPGPMNAAPRCSECGGEVPALFARMATAIHHVLEEASEAHAVLIPEDVLTAAENPGKEFGRYILVNLVGRGGSGEVYRAWQKDANRIVALKLLPHLPRAMEGERTPYGDATSVKQFFTEARAIADLDHPGIVPILDYGTVADSFYYTMPLIDGMSLEALLRGPHPEAESLSPLPARALPERLSLSIVRDVALALDHAHRSGVCHRDIKPANILVDRAGKSWLIDFGLARVARLGKESFEKGMIVGTPHYMAPEQALGDMEKVDELSDLYSLGTVLYELLSGFWPYSDRSSDEALKVVPLVAPRPLAELVPGVSRELVGIVERAMARDRAGRYQSAAHLVRDLDTVLRRGA